MPDLLLFPSPGGPADANARADALDIQQSWIVEAPAGSGKTGLLIQRYLKLLADKSVSEPEQVLAITFTTKATAELRERVLGQLQAATDGTVPTNGFDRATRLLAEKVLSRDRERGWTILDEPQRFNIRTIDSVCAEIANSLPLLSGSGGRRSPVEDATPHYALAARRTFLELGGPDRDLHEALSNILLHRDGNLAECEKLLGEMLALRDQWGEFIPVGRTNFDDAWLDANVLPKLERALDQAICAALTQLAEIIPEDVLAQLTTAAADMAHIEGHKIAVSPIAICAGKHRPPAAIAEELEHWRALLHLVLAPSTQSWRRRFYRGDVKFEISKSDGIALAAIVEKLKHDDQLLAAICKIGTLPPAKYPADQWAVARSLFRVLNRALAELQLVFAERNECDFAEVSLAAHSALQSTDGLHDLEAALGVRLQHVLVDEMQDTSSRQYELVETLTRNWDGHSQTVFLVGDPKQSIYLFRQARVERFLRTMRTGQLGDLPVGDLRLTVNFRSQPALVDDFNADFAGIFPAASDGLHPEEVPYVHASSARLEPAPEDTAGSLQHSPAQSVLPLNYSLFPLFEDDPPAMSARDPSSNGDAVSPGLSLAASASATPRIWHATVLPYEADSIKKARKTLAQRTVDAATVRSIVNHWRARPLPPGRTGEWKIAVLCRSRNHLDEIVPAFRAAAIPFRAVDIDPLKERPEVQDLVALTRALLHPADRVAWLAILRAPWCGLSLADLHTLSGADDPAWAEHSMQQVVAERGHLLPDDACQRLARIWPALEAAVKARAQASWAQLVERTWRTIGGDSYLNAAELANSTRYLQLINEIEAQLEQTSGVFDLSLLEGPLDRLYAAPGLESGAVDLLTIHKAKGLEWDVVIVPALERPAPISRYRLLNWVELDSSDEEAAHVLLAPISGKGEPSQALTKWIRGIYNGREAAERKRLFYVACTRAREELHLFAAPMESAKRSVRPAPNSLLAAAWPAAALHFSTNDFAEPAQQGQSFAIAASSDDDDAFENAEEVEEVSIEASIDGTAIETVSANNQLNLRIANPTTPLQRLPLDFNPSMRFRNEHPVRYGNHPDTPAAPRFERPDGTIAARAFGNAVHAFLEQIALQIAAGEAPAKVLAALPSWLPRIVATLRSEGLQPAAVDRLAQRVVFALETTLKDPAGLWLLSAHPDAANEYALTAWVSQRSNVRIDRIFRAGPGPLSLGTDHLWIVDYKTTNHGGGGLEAFLADEKAKYAPQLQAYAAVLSETQDVSAIRLALYYPLLARLVWWPWNVS